MWQQKQQKWLKFKAVFNSFTFHVSLLLKVNVLLIFYNVTFGTPAWYSKNTNLPYLQLSMSTLQIYHTASHLNMSTIITIILLLIHGTVISIQKCNKLYQRRKTSFITLMCEQHDAHLQHSCMWNKTGRLMFNCLEICSLTFRHRASCILGQASHYSPERFLYI